MAKTWSTQTARYLADRTVCPRCDAGLTHPGSCGNCGADLSTPIAQQVWDASGRAAEAIAVRQSLIESLTNVERQTAPAPLPAMARPAPVDVALASSPTSSPSGSQVSVQSVLAVAGAALFAIAAIVFTFLNPDLTNFGTRTAIVGAVTVLFLGGAWLLARAKLQFSAEAIGALGMVFVVLDIWAFSTLAWPGVSGWVFGGIGTLTGSVIMGAFASLARIRTWLWVALVGLALTPAFFGYAVGGVWATTLGHLAVVACAFGVHEVIRRLKHRFSTPLLADRTTATVLQIGFTVLVLAQIFVAPTALEAAGVVGILAIVAALSTRNQLAVLWSAVAGAFFVAAIGILPFAFDLTRSEWRIAVIPTAGAAAIAALSALAVVDAGRPATSLRRPALLIGGGTVALVSALPAAFFALTQIMEAFDPEVPAARGGPAIVGVAAASASTLALSLILRRVAVGKSVPPDAALAHGALIVALWTALLAVLATSTWPGLPDFVRVIIGLAVAVALSALITRVTRIRSLPSFARAPLITGAHLAIALAAVIVWTSPLLSIVGGASVVLVVIAATYTVPAKFLPVHTAVGFAYALIVLAHALTLAHLDLITVLCLTASAASLFALVVTLIRRFNAGFWYAILAVTLVPFLIGIGSVLFVRSGWTALSTAVTFALAVTLVVTRRPGLSRALRTFAASLLVPALAVVVVCLGAQVLTVSASPITLPIIAVIVACVLPSTALIGASLLRHGLPETDVRAATLWIEISALITAALAVVLALARAAAGLNTSFVVLLIIGLGAAAAALTTRRRYAWAVAGASWTGALWCVWAITGVTIIEPYLLPPALAAAIVGAISVSRKLPGLGLYSIGLACAVIPSLIALAGWGNGGGVFERVCGLLAGAILLIAIGAVPTSRAKRTGMQRLSVLRTPTILIGLVAAFSGTVEAVRLGLSLEPIGLAPIMVPVLVFSTASTLLAIHAGTLLLRAARSNEPAGFPPRFSTSRWMYAPAAIYLVLGPIAAVRDDWFSISALWLLTAALLIVMLGVVARGRTQAVSLPPVWFLFALAWCTAVAGWSERQLRVEAFSLPLGLALLAAGILAMRLQAQPETKNLNSWPVGYSGSWRLLTPGIVVTLLPSILATGTDPLTLRAILVIALALIAILIGSLRKLGAPFMLGIIVLPLENITVFAVQVGHSIGAAPWWITLATAGAVLLVVSVTYERRDADDRGVAARLRDLR